MTPNARFNDITRNKQHSQFIYGNKGSCMFDLHSTTQVVSRLHATVLGKYQPSKTVKIEVDKKMPT
jgi:hypothetical protein